MKHEPEITELLGQMRLIHTVLTRMSDDANDAWCEEGGGWSVEDLGWCQRAEDELKRSADGILALLKEKAKEGQ